MLRTLFSVISNLLLIFSLITIGKAAPAQEIATENSEKAVVIFDSFPADQENLQGPEQYHCTKFTKDAHCLDKYNEAVNVVWHPIYPESNPAYITVTSQDFENGYFEVKVEGQPAVSDYNSCVEATTEVNSPWDRFVIKSRVRFTVCFVKNIWYYRFAYN